MKLEKVMFYLPAAVDMANKRKAVDLNHTQVVILYFLRHFGAFRAFHLYKTLLSFGYPIGEPTSRYSLQYLLSIQFIERTGKAYTIAPLGREYLSLIRRYLLNKRL